MSRRDLWPALIGFPVGVLLRKKDASNSIAIHASDAEKRIAIHASAVAAWDEIGELITHAADCDLDEDCTCGAQEDHGADVLEIIERAMTRLVEGLK